jgi:hypothetical protein
MATILIDRNLNEYLGLNRALAITDSWLLGTNGGASTKFNVVSMRDHSETPVGGISGSTPSMAAVTEDKGQAFFVASDQGARDQSFMLMRVNLLSANGAAVTDGVFSYPHPIVSIGKYLIDWNDGSLEVREPQNGDLICVWPVTYFGDRRPQGLFVHRGNNALVLLGGFPFTGSLLVNIASLDSLADKCGPGTLRAKAALDAASEVF